MNPVTGHRSIGDMLPHLEVALDLAIPLLCHHSPKSRSVLKPSVRLSDPQHLNSAWLQSVVDGDAAGATISMTAGANGSMTHGANRSITVGANRSMTAGANRSVTAGANRSLTTGANRSVTACAKNL